jgi:hypothetical protein
MEEQMREKAGFYDDEESEEDENMKFIRETAKKIRVKKKLLAVSHLILQDCLLLRLFCFHSWSVKQDTFS